MQMTSSGPVFKNKPAANTTGRTQNCTHRTLKTSSRLSSNTDRHSHSPPNDSADCCCFCRSHARSVPDPAGFADFFQHTAKTTHTVSPLADAHAHSASADTQSNFHVFRRPPHAPSCENTTPPSAPTSAAYHTLLPALPS